MHQRNPGARVTGVLQETYLKEFRTAARWEERYAESWKTLNPFETPARPRSDMAATSLPRLPTAPNSVARDRQPLPASPLRDHSASPPAGTTHNSPSPPNSVSATPALGGSLNSGLGSSPMPSISQRCPTAPHSPSPARTLACQKRNYHHLAFSDARKEFYNQFIAKPQYRSADIV